MLHKHKPERHKQCPFCDFKSPNIQKIQIHIDRYHQKEGGEKKHLCDICSTTFIYQTSLSYHKYFKCTKFIGERFPIGKRKRSTKTYQPKFTCEIKCDYCEQTLKSSIRIKLHYKNQHPGKSIIAEGHKKYNCTHCDDFFFTDYECQQHLNIKHDVETEINFCKKCKKGYFKEHDYCKADYHYPSQKKEILCDKCNSDFTTNQGLKRHIKSVHENIRYPCNQCDKTYSNEKLLRSHNQSVHENCQDFVCKPCGKIFGSHFKLGKHNWQSHSQMTCDICGRVVANNQRLQKHKVFVHNQTDGVWFCEKCPKDVFFAQKMLDKHIRNKHSL